MGWQDRGYYNEGGGGLFGGERGGGGMGGRPQFRFPKPTSVTLWMIVANVIVFFVNGFTGKFVGGGDVQGAGLIFEWGNLNYEQGVLGFQVWRFFSYQFIHGDFWHIFFNMLMLFFFGPMVERYLGSKRFIVFYLLSGVGGGALYLGLSVIGLYTPANLPFVLPQGAATSLIGASGCVFGILVACLKVAPDSTVLLFFVLPIKLKVMVWFALLLNLYSAMVGDGSSVAHLGGAAVGALLVWRIGVLNAIADRAKSPDEIRESIAELREKRQKKKAVDLDAEVDRILAKVHEHGMHSLTKKEKKTLKQATESKRGG